MKTRELEKLVEKLLEVEKLQEEYYELCDEERDLDDMVKRFDELEITIPEIEFTKANKTIAYVCPDPEWEFPTVYILKDDEKRIEYIDKIGKAIAEYYSHCSFYDEVTALCVDELVAITIAVNRIPVTAIYDSEKTDLLNVRYLRSIAEW